jgi:hypothetical protein
MRACCLPADMPIRLAGLERTCQTPTVISVMTQLGHWCLDRHLKILYGNPSLEGRV